MYIGFQDPAALPAIRSGNPPHEPGFKTRLGLVEANNESGINLRKDVGICQKMESPETRCCCFGFPFKQLKWDKNALNPKNEPILLRGVVLLYVLALRE